MWLVSGPDPTLQTAGWFPLARREPGSLGFLAKPQFLYALPLSPFPLEPQSQAAGGREAVDQLIVLNLSTQIFLSPESG